MRVEYLEWADRDRLTDGLMKARAGTLSTDEKCALFDELAERFGHNTLAESLKAFGLR